MPLILYTRQGCPLCEDFEQEVCRHQQVLNFELEIRDVDSNPAWIVAYNDKVPLLVAENPDLDQEICRYFFDPRALRAYLTKPRT